MRHTALLNEQKIQWESDARTVFVEGQNAFRLRGKSATLAGRPDLVVLDDRDATIIDVKTGREQPWHRVQVMIYQYALPLALPQYRNVRFGGEVIYPTHTVRIPRGALPNQFNEDLGRLIRRLAADTPPRRVPSGPECRFCDISTADCPESGWTTSTSPRAEPPTTFDPQFHVIARPLDSWDNSRRWLAIPIRPPESRLCTKFGFVAKLAHTRLLLNSRTFPMSGAGTRK